MKDLQHAAAKNHHNSQFPSQRSLENPYQGHRKDYNGQIADKANNTICEQDFRFRGDAFARDMDIPSLVNWIAFEYMDEESR